MINAYLQENGLKVSTGTIVDATIIDAPSSTKNKDGERDPEMHQTKKGNQWYFGMKGHIGVDSQTKLKRIFGFNKVRYRGLDKNANRLFVACGLVNLYMARRQLLRPT